MAKAAGKLAHARCATSKCDYVTMALGVLLIAAPWALGYGAHVAAAVSSVVAGAAIFICALVALTGLPRPFEEAGAACGVMAAAAPWFVGFLYVHQATTAHVAIGMSVALLSLAGIWWARSRVPTTIEAKRA